MAGATFVPMREQRGIRGGVVCPEEASTAEHRFEPLGCSGVPASAIGPEQPVVEVPRRTETGEAPGDQGARRANIGNIHPTSNAERRDASPVECSGTFTTGC
jgi:hypothetical protein